MTSYQALEVTAWWKNSGSDSILVARTNDSGASTSHPLATFVLFSDEEHIILVEIKFVLKVCVHEEHVISIEIKLVWNVWIKYDDNTQQHLRAFQSQQQQLQLYYTVQL